MLSKLRHSRLTLVNSIFYSSKRLYALSRFPERNPGVRRTQNRPSQRVALTPSGQELDSIHRAAETFNEPAKALVADDGALRKLLFSNNTLVVERQLEMLNVLAGFEQSNRYTISNEDGEPLGFIAEDPKGFLGTLARQVLRAHRPFRAVVMDNTGAPLLFFNRPFSWINSRMHVQRLKDHSNLIPGVEPKLDVFGEVQQEWHLWRRRYDLFLRELAVPKVFQHGQDIKKLEPMFYQVARVDAGFLAWQFALHDENGNEIASMLRAFKGFGREIFTDTGRYSVNFTPRELVNDRPINEITGPERANLSRELSLDERALFLALAVNIDFDYFSRHSHFGGGGFIHMPFWD